MPSVVHCMNATGAVTKICTKFLPVNNFCQLLRVTHKHSCTSVGNAQAQLHFQDDQQRAFGISNISNCFEIPHLWPQHLVGRIPDQRITHYWGQRAYRGQSELTGGQIAMECSMTTKFDRKSPRPDCNAC